MHLNVNICSNMLNIESMEAKRRKSYRIMILNNIVIVTY